MGSPLAIKDIIKTNQDSKKAKKECKQEKPIKSNEQIKAERNLCKNVYLFNHLQHNMKTTLWLQAITQLIITIKNKEHNINGVELD